MVMWKGGAAGMGVMGEDMGGLCVDRTEGARCPRVSRQTLE
jgi:hypothetical protein